MASLDITTMDAVLKQHYVDMRVENMVYKDEPLLAWLPKYTKFGGKNLPLPIQYATVAGRSQAFLTAQGNAAPSKFEDFVLTRVHDYAVAHIDNEAMMASMGDRNAFLQATVTEINGAIRAATRSLATALPRSGTGSIGAISSSATVASATLLLATPEDVVNFEVGMSIVASLADGGALRDSGAAATISAIDRDAGSITTAGGNWSTQITGLSTGDFLYVEGDAADGGSNVKLSGLDAWLPATVPGTSFFGVTRTTDATRLGGQRYDISASGETLEEGLMSAAARVHREGGRPETVWMNPLEWVKLSKELGSRVVHDIVSSSNGKIGFQGIKLASPKGSMTVLADHNIPMGVAYMLDRSTWKLYSLGKAPQILTYGDGAGRFLRRSSADGVEVRVGYYAQLGCTAPGYNCRITLPS